MIEPELIEEECSTQKPQSLNQNGFDFAQLISRYYSVIGKYFKREIE